MATGLKLDPSGLDDPSLWCKLATFQIQIIICRWGGGGSSYSDTPYSDSSEFLFSNCWLKLGWEPRYAVSYVSKEAGKSRNYFPNMRCVAYKQEICAKNIRNMPKYAPTMSENMQKYAGNMRT